MEFTEMGCFDGSWTNEKHSSFLNWMEASFVRRMLENDNCPLLTCALGDQLRLDRYLPDTAESTRNFDCRRNGKRSQQNRGTVERRRRRRRRDVRKGSSRQENATQDQVVPQLGGTKSNKTERVEEEEEEEEEREGLEIVVTSHHQ